MKERGKKLSGALRNDPKNRPMERLSPGVYRSAGGGLVSQSGQQIQRQPQAPMQLAQPQAPAQPASSQGSPSMILGLSQGESQRLRDMMQRNFNPMGGGSESEQQMPMDKMYRWPQAPQMPQPSANMGGQYRLSPGADVSVSSSSRSKRS
jgi:hypothetical protein